MACLSTITGLGQAAILIILVRAATALTADTALISGSIGPITATDLTTNQLILLGFGILVALFVAEFATSWAEASLLSSARRSTQRRLLAAYSASSLDTQTVMTRGESYQLLLGHTANSASLVSSIGSGMVSIVNFVTLFVSALVLSAVAGLVVLVGLILTLLMLRPLVLASRRVGRTRAVAQRTMAGLFAERLELSREVKSFGVDDEIDQPLRRQIDRIASLVHRLRLLARVTSASYRIAGYGITLAMLALIERSGASNLAALTGSLLILLRSLSYGQAAQTTFQQLSENIPIVEQLVEEEARLRAGAEPSTMTEPVSRLGRIAFRSVSHAYPGGETVLHDVSFDLNEGDFLALVGPSGAGKSTLMYLLLRLRTPTGGEINVDGVSAAEIDLATWRRRVAYVPQEPKLQSGTVTEAIRFHRSEITDTDVVSAARMAHIADEIEQWPDGYDTDVGQLGEALSGGQRQRIALARALAGRPDLLLLDEPTSAIDPRSEELIGETLETLRGQMTIVVIAHRFTTVKRANRVILIRDGRVIPHEKDDLTTLATFMEIPSS